jgi:hypothetical protein
MDFGNASQTHSNRSKLLGSLHNCDTKAQEKGTRQANSSIKQSAAHMQGQANQSKMRKADLSDANSVTFLPWLSLQQQ